MGKLSGKAPAKAAEATATISPEAILAALAANPELAKALGVGQAVGKPAKAAKAAKAKVPDATDINITAGSKPGYVEIRFSTDDGEAAMPSAKLKAELKANGFRFNMGEKDGNGPRYWGHRKMLVNTTFESFLNE